MAPSFSRGRRRRSYDSDESDDDVSRASTPVSTAPNDRKRMRTDTTAESSIPYPSRGTGCSGNLVASLQSNGGRSGSKREHQPGSIVRVKLTNFVTYTAAEFYPGPNLNMVIGPNGTGKSTIVCAICLGLGWSPSLLGRAKDPSEFVKHGAKEAIIEIELQRAQGGSTGTKRNPVIRRRIRKDENKSNYSLNGNTVSHKEVQRLMADFNIQVDNLCQFLPQDRVVEFARMTPVEMLRTTLKAAADPEVIEYHERLCELRQEQKEFMGSNRGDREQLENLQKRQAAQQIEVERLKERIDTQAEISRLEKCMILGEYTEARTEISAAKKVKEKLKAETAKLTENALPALRRVDAKRVYIEQAREACERLNAQATKAVNNCKRLDQAISNFDSAIRECDSRSDAENNQGKQDKASLAKYQTALRSIESRKQQEPEPFDSKAINEQIQQLSREIRSLQESEEPLTTSLTTHKESMNSLSGDRARLQRRLEALDTEQGQQETRLQTSSEVTYRAWMWIRENQDKFQHEVFGPPAVTCQVKDPALAGALESLLQRNDFNIFTVQSFADFKVLQQELLFKQRLSGLSLRTCTRQVSEFQKPFDDEALYALGMERWAIDCLDGPPIVLGMLCQDKSLHQIGISTRSISSEQHERIVASELKSYVAGNKLARFVRRAEYGNAGVSARILDVREPTVWTDKPVDAQARQELTGQLRVNNMRQHEEREAINDLQSRLGEIQAERRTKVEQQDSLRREKEQKQRALTEWNGLDAKIEHVRSQVVATQEKISSASQRRAAILREKDDAMFARIETVLEYCEAVHNLNLAQEQSLEAEVTLIGAQSDLENLDSLNAAINATLKKKSEELKAVEISFNDKVKAANHLVTKIADLKNESDQLAEDGDERLRDLVRELSSIGKNLTVRTIEEKVEALTSRLDLIAGGLADASTIAEFEARGEKIARLQERMQNFEQQQQHFIDSIKTLRDMFEDNLEPIVTQIDQAFGESFSRIGCAGQVTVHKASSTDAADCTDIMGGAENGLEFEDWAIHIYVKFRENEPLSLLDSHRQSGGERAVSTIFYLMALQSLSKSPFRVVDEINQGMDPRNERMVHGRMVDIAAANEKLVAEGKSSGSQYFLITPKLLSGLKYERGMTVLCIVSGENMPSATDVKRRDQNGAEYVEKGKKIDFIAFAKRARELGYGKSSTLHSGRNAAVIPASSIVSIYG